MEGFQKTSVVLLYFRGNATIAVTRQVTWWSPSFTVLYDLQRTSTQYILEAPKHISWRYYLRFYSFGYRGPLRVVMRVGGEGHIWIWIYHTESCHSHHPHWRLGSLRLWDTVVQWGRRARCLNRTTATWKFYFMKEKKIESIFFQNCTLKMYFQISIWELCPMSLKRGFHSEAAFSESILVALNLMDHLCILAFNIDSE